MSLSVLNNFELCYRGTGTSSSRGGPVIAAVFLAHNYVSEQFGNYVEYGMPIISKLYPYSLQSYWTSKFGKIIPYTIFAHKRALPCVTKNNFNSKTIWRR